jgi:hypothetical protein
LPTTAARQAVLHRVDETYAYILLPELPLDDDERPILTGKLRHTKAAGIILAMHDQIAAVELAALAEVAADDMLLMILLHVKTFTAETRAALVERCVANAAVFGPDAVLSGLPDLTPAQRLSLIRALSPQSADRFLDRSQMQWSDGERDVLEALADQLPSNDLTLLEGINWDALMKVLKQ